MISDREMDDLRLQVEATRLDWAATEPAGGAPALESYKRHVGALKALHDAQAAQPQPAVPAGTLDEQAQFYATMVDRTDAGNANLLIKLAGGNLRYVVETRQWLRWNGARWHIDDHETFINRDALGNLCTGVLL